MPYLSALQQDHATPYPWAKCHNISPCASCIEKDTNKRGYNSHINAYPIYLRRSKIMPLLIRGQNATKISWYIYGRRPVKAVAVLSMWFSFPAGVFEDSPLE